MELAIYGKGGIGKSTISANLSLALAKKGRRVLQVGCDPKRDSTRLLLRGTRIETVLEYLRETPPDRCRISDILHEGALGVHCVEAGGPEPGVGCAGRGILTTFELLHRLGVKENRYDAILYDVLGDVVCGGFAVPIRHEYADKVYIVTSGEFMSLYAANNILRGLGNFDWDGARAGGVILNSRGLADEDRRVVLFCEAVGLPLIERFPKSALFSESENEARCLVECFPDSDIAEKFECLADFIYRQCELYRPLPLSDDDLEERLLGKKPRPFLFGKKSAPVPENVSRKPVFYSKGLISREPLQGCAFSGALTICTQVADSVCIAHGPNSCAHIAYQNITSTPRRFLLERGIVLPHQTAPPIVSSGMNESVMVFGGAGILRQKLEETLRKKPKAVFVLTTCPSGIIGDNLDFLHDCETSETRVIPLLTDGNLRGDYLQGILTAYMGLARALVDPAVASESDTVNLIAEKTEADATRESYENIVGILGRLGLRINCRFINGASIESLRNFKRGRLNFLAYADYMGRTIRSFLEKEFDAPFFDKAFPVGFHETCDWTRQVGEFFGKKDAADALIAEGRARYDQEIAEIRPWLEGKRLMMITYSHEIDWILQAACDLGMEIAFVGILSFSQENLFKTRFEDRILELHVPYDNGRRSADIARVAPDLFLTNYASIEHDGSTLTDTIPLCPTAGFLSGVFYARRWSELFRTNLKEGWKRDEPLYRKYCA
ncbi:MAG: AAA family ATPase [Candidatus Accumulibacter sp.]|jgi:nitrogenase iron protein|nr:AAA family ATPase [Accumulibacter sp.]